jgi:hypothetical protein
MKKAIAYYPFLLAVYPTLFLWSRNAEMVSPREVVLPAIAALMAALAAWGVCWPLRRTRSRAFLLAGFWVLVLQSFRPFQLMPHPLGVWLLVIAAGTALILFLPAPPSGLTQCMNLACLVLLCFPLVALVRAGASYYTMSHHLAGEGERLPADARDQRTSGEVRPNIYHLILDAYARQDVLRDLYGFDNGPFVQDLERMGFTCIPLAQTNYWQTLPSLASMLNMSYLSPVPGNVGYFTCEPGRHGRMTDLIRESNVSRYLTRKGYRTVAFSTGYERVELRNTSVFKEVPGTGLARLSYFQQEVLNGTPVPKILDRFAPVASASSEMRRNQILNTLDHLADTSDRSVPLFVFAHVMAPHPGFVFHADGTPRSSGRPFSGADGSAFYAEGGTREEYSRAYIEQLRFISRKALASIELIEKRSSRPTVIIVQSDHGPGRDLDWDHPEKTNFYERMSILLALRLPPGLKRTPPEDLSPVNLYRYLFSELFHEDFPLLPPGAYYMLEGKLYEVPPKSLSVANGSRMDYCGRRRAGRCLD